MVITASCQRAAKDYGTQRGIAAIDPRYLLGAAFKSAVKIFAARSGSSAASV